MNERKEKSFFLCFAECLLLGICVLVVMLSTAYIGTETQEEAEVCLYPRDYREYVEEAAEAYGVEANMIYAIIKAESSFCETVVSKRGAIGLMQILPDTFLFDIRDAIGLSESSSSVLFSARENILAGTYYFARWRSYFGADKEALAAYNAGVGNVQKWLADESLSDLHGLILDAIPFSETRAYVSRVLEYKEKYDELYGKETLPSPERVDVSVCYEWACRYGEQFHIDPRFVMAIIHAESGFAPSSVSTSGAVGLMQIKEDTYISDIKANLHLEEDFEALFDAEFSVKCGTYYLHWLDARLDGLEQLAAAYNGGIGNVKRWLADPAYSEDGVTLLLDEIPREETRRFVRKVMIYYESYCAAYPLQDE